MKGPKEITLFKMYAQRVSNQFYNLLPETFTGARAVFVGRPLLWGLHHSGKEGAEKVLTILRDEFKNTLQLIGAPSPRDLTSDMLIKADSSTDMSMKRTEL